MKMQGENSHKENEWNRFKYWNSIIKQYEMGYVGCGFAVMDELYNTIGSADNGTASFILVLFFYTLRCWNNCKVYKCFQVRDIWSIHGHIFLKSTQPVLEGTNCRYCIHILLWWEGKLSGLSALRRRWTPVALI